jgi:hypothetical protein
MSRTYSWRFAINETTRNPPASNTMMLRLYPTLLLAVANAAVAETEATGLRSRSGCCEQYHPKAASSPCSAMILQ